MDPKQFADPAAAYRGVTLWMLNDRLEPAEIERQLRGFREAGLGAVITRTFDGLGTEYLSEEWMAILQRIVAVAGEIGVGVWFQAGYMPNGIPELPEHLEAKALVARRRAEPPEPGDSTVAERGETVYAERRLRHVLDLLSPEAGRSYVRQAYERTYGKRFADDLGRTVQAVWVDEPSFLPPMLPWSDRLAGLYRRRWGEEIAPHVPSLFARVGDFRRARHRYWRTVVEMFLEGYFAEVSAWCGAHGLKFTGHLMGEETLFSQIAWTGSAMPAYAHMHIPGVDHLTRSMTWTHGATWDFAGPPFLITPKQCSSVANQTGSQAALAEMYGVSSQGLTFRDRKRIGDFLAVAGINFRCLHGSFYSLRGRRKRIYPPHLSAQQPWWPDNRIVADYFARLSYALRQGTFQADVLVIHPIESAYCVFDPLAYEFSRPDRVPEEIAGLNASLAALSENLMKIHRGFEYGDEGLLARMGSVAAGRLGVGEMTYRAVILPSVISLRESTVELLCRWLDSGGPVLSVGEMPTRIEGAEDERIEELNRRIRKVANEPGALAAALAEAVPPAVEVRGLDGPCEDVWLHERSIPGGRVVFLANVSPDAAAEIELRLRPAGRLEEWDPATGEVHPVAQRADGDGVVTTLPVAPAGSRLIVLRQDEPVVETARRTDRPVRSIPLAGPWRIRRHAPNAWTLDFCRLRRPGGAFTAPIPVIAAQELLTEQDYRGPVALQFAFQADLVPRDLRLVVEQPDACRITVNGREVRYAGLEHYVDRSFLPIDIAAAAQVGENVVEITRDFQPLAKPTIPHGGRFQDLPGVELENVYLIGDFAVAGRISPRPQRPACARYEPRFVLTRERQVSDGDLLADGYPFYSGRLSLTGSVDLTADDCRHRAVLALPQLHACVAKVRVNGGGPRTIAWPPYVAEITPFVRRGHNEIEIELTNTLRNLLGPHHRPSGEPDNVWGEMAFSGRWCPATRRGDDRWWEHRRRETDAWTDDYFFVPFGPGEGSEVRIIR